MPESTIGLPPDSTGKKVRSRQRTIGANSVEEQYFIEQNERVVTARSYITSPRLPTRASASQPMFSIWNGSSASNVSVRRLSVEVDSISAVIVASSYLRVYRVTAAPTGGLAITKVQQDTNETMNAAIVALSDAQSDNVVATTAMAGTPVAGILWSQLVPRWQTLAGYQALAPLNLLPDDSNLNKEDPLVLRPSQGFLVRFEAPAAVAAGAYTMHFKASIGEFTVP